MGCADWEPWRHSRCKHNCHTLLLQSHPFTFGVIIDSYEIVFIPQSPYCHADPPNNNVPINFKLHFSYLCVCVSYSRDLAYAVVRTACGSQSLPPRPGLGDQTWIISVAAGFSLLSNHVSFYFASIQIENEDQASAQSC